MTALFMLVLVVVVAATLVDRLVATDSSDEWRRSSRDLMSPMEERGHTGLPAQAHYLFCRFFDRVYGKKTWSFRRVWASLVSSGLGLVVVVLVIGPSRTFLGTLFGDIASQGELDKERTILLSFVVGALATILNLIPDFFSLAETRIVLRWARGRGPLGLFALTALDLVLTVAIFVLVPCGIWGLFLWDDVRIGDFGRYIVGVGGLLPFFMTTFITSLGWILYVACIVAIRVLCLHPVTRFVVHEMGRSERPTLAFSSLAVMLIVLVWLPASLLFGTPSARELPRSWTRASASMIELDRSYTGHFMSQVQYWVHFQGQAGQRYRIETETSKSSSADTLLELYGSGSAPVAIDDDGGSLYFDSLINFDCDSTQVFTVRILNIALATPSADFTLRITASRSEASNGGSARD